MGTVADRIAKRLVSFRTSKTTDLSGWREGRAMAREAGFGEDAAFLGKFSDHDPCHALYVIGQNVASLMAESISGMKEAKGYVRIVGDAEDEYVPSGPPMSPLTHSYFTMWALFDVRFGSSRETMGSCILRIAPEFDCPTWLVDTIGRMQQSRMGFYVHCGSEQESDSEGVLLRDVGTGEFVSCMVPTGYAGCAGEIWFVRVLEPPNEQCVRHIVFNTPYVIRNYPESAFVDYLDRELTRMKRKKPPGMDDEYVYLMKYGPDPNHWNEYIFCAYSNHRDDAVFLTGIPDVRQSLPHASDHR